MSNVNNQNLRPADYYKDEPCDNNPHMTKREAYVYSRPDRLSFIRSQLNGIDPIQHKQSWQGYLAGKASGAECEVIYMEYPWILGDKPVPSKDDFYDMLDGKYQKDQPNIEVVEDIHTTIYTLFKDSQVIVDFNDELIADAGLNESSDGNHELYVPVETGHEVLKLKDFVHVKDNIFNVGHNVIKLYSLKPIEFTTVTPIYI